MFWKSGATRIHVLPYPQAIGDLREALGEDAISTDDEDLHRHGYSEWSSINIEQLPVAVAYPKSTEEVAELAKICFKYKIPMSEFAIACFQLKLISQSSLLWRNKLRGKFRRSIRRDEH